MRTRQVAAVLSPAPSPVEPADDLDTPDTTIESR